MTTIEKPSYNEEFRTVQFLRPDGHGQLSSGESISSCEVVCSEVLTGTETTAEMVESASPYDQTQVLYMLKGGDLGKNYLLQIRIVTSAGQKLAETFLVKVNS